MNKNLAYGIICALVILCIGEGYWIVRERNAKIALSLGIMAQKQQMPKMSPPPKGKPSFIMKGMKFSDSPLFSKAYLIAPVSGDLSKDAQIATTGWTVNSTANSDGSVSVDLVPKEAEDVKQSFTVKPGYKLYFIEMTLVDDGTGVDENRGDDIGVLVDPNGMVQ